MNLADNGIGDEGRFLAFVFFGVSTLLLSVIGAAVIGYIEGLRLDAILYARVVNSIRDYFFKLPGAETFGPSVLPTKRDRPSYDGFGAGFIMYFACATMNAAYSAVGVLALMLDRSTPLVSAGLTSWQLGATVLAFLAMLALQALIRQRLLAGKQQKGF